jgi:hypothetical protein
VLTHYGQSEKTWLWCHTGLTAPWTWRVLGSSCLACCYISSASQEKEAEGWCPCPVRKTSQWSVAQGNGGQAEQEHIGDLRRSGWGNQFFTAVQIIRVSRFSMSTGLCATWGWISLCRIGRRGSHCDTTTALISGSHQTTWT